MTSADKKPRVNIGTIGHISWERSLEPPKQIELPAPSLPTPPAPDCLIMHPTTYARFKAQPVAKNFPYPVHESALVPVGSILAVGKCAEELKRIEEEEKAKDPRP